MELSLNRKNSTKLGLNDNEKYLQQHKIRIPDEPEKSRYTWLMDCDYGGKNVFRVNFIVYDWSVITFHYTMTIFDSVFIFI